MCKYNNFIGIDIAKKDFVVSLYGEHKTFTFSNNKKGFNSFCQKYKVALSSAFIVLETTGGYENALLEYLVEKEIAVHRGNARRIKNFIRSLRDFGKTDIIDAQGIAQYAAERHHRLEIYEIPSESSRKLLALSHRRNELVKMRAAEKTRLKGPTSSLTSKSLKATIRFFDKEINRIEEEIEGLINADAALCRKVEVLQTLPGVGKITSIALISNLPELGTLKRREVAHLAGVAPHPYDSGDSQGYRSTRGGREAVKPILFISAMAASRGKHRLGQFYRGLVEGGKKPIVALVALMRKIIVMANARIRDLQMVQA